MVVRTGRPVVQREARARTQARNSPETDILIRVFPPSHKPQNFHK
jgi:hypothetical protein